MVMQELGKFVVDLTKNYAILSKFFISILSPVYTGFGLY